MISIKLQSKGACGNSKDVCGTLSNIYDGAFFVKIVNGFPQEKLHHKYWTRFHDFQVR